MPKVNICMKIWAHSVESCQIGQLIRVLPFLSIAFLVVVQLTMGSAETDSPSSILVVSWSWAIAMGRRAAARAIKAVEDAELEAIPPRDKGWTAMAWFFVMCKQAQQPLKRLAAEKGTSGGK